MSTVDTSADTLADHAVITFLPTRTDQRFCKQQRLLLPREFKAVFDAATIKASHKSLLLLARPTDTATAVATPRLGLVVAKKHARLAVQRNRIKRLLRESFRRHQSVLAGLDIIALARPGLWQMDNQTLIATIEAQWQRLLKQKQRGVS